MIEKNDQGMNLLYQFQSLSTQIVLYLEGLMLSKRYTQWGYGSLYTFLVQRWGLSKYLAYTHTKTLKLMIRFSPAKEALQSGRTNVTSLFFLQSFIEALEQFEKRKLLTEEMNSLLLMIMDKPPETAKECLENINPTFYWGPLQSYHSLNRHQTKITFVAQKDLLAKIHEIRALTSHQFPKANLSENIQWMTDLAIKQLKKKKPDSPIGPIKPLDNRSLTGSLELSTDRSSVSRYISTHMRRAIWIRAQGRCEYQSKEGFRCLSKYQLEIDHIHPFSLGGRSDDVNNLQLLCKSHNLYRSEQTFGKKNWEHRK